MVAFGAGVSVLERRASLMACGEFGCQEPLMTTMSVWLSIELLRGDQPLASLAVLA